MADDRSSPVTVDVAKRLLQIAKNMGGHHAPELRKLAAALRAGHAQRPADTGELLERADEYLGTIVNKGNCGPHHLVSDLAAALRGIALSHSSTDRMKM